MAKRVKKENPETGEIKKRKTRKASEAVAPEKSLIPLPAAEQASIPVLENSPEHFSLFTDFDIELFKAGKHFHLYKKLGSHLVEHNGVAGTYFAVWAP